MAAKAAADYDKIASIDRHVDNDELSNAADDRRFDDRNMNDYGVNGRTDNDGLTALLRHLHSKITAFESERVSWLARFEAARLSQDARAAAVRMLRELNTEYLDLGRAVSECRVQTWEAKMQRMELQRENKELEHLKSAHQAQRTEELAAVFDEVEAKQVVNHRTGQKPHKVTKFTMNEVATKSNRPNDLSLKQSKNSQANNKRAQGRFETMTEPDKKTKAMYKTVVIPKDIALNNAHDDSLDNHVALAVPHSNLDLQIRGDSQKGRAQQDVGG